MKLLKLSPDDIISLWEEIEREIPVDSQEEVAKTFINKLIDLKADYNFLDMLRNYNNNLDYYLDNKMMELQNTKKTKTSSYYDDDEENIEEEYDFEY